MKSLINKFVKFFKLDYFSEKGLKAVVFLAVAVAIGALVFAFMFNFDNSEYAIKSSPVLTDPVTMDLDSIDVLTESCNNFGRVVYVEYDTIWNYHPEFDGDSQPGVNGFSGGNGVKEGGPGCDSPTMEPRVAPIPLGDPDNDAPAGGMWPGYWSMSSAITIKECINPYEKDPPSNRTMNCEFIGPEIGEASWHSDVFKIVAGG